jgi:two-component system response regulator MprA
MKRILIVDDEQAMREGIAELLRLEGYTVVTAADGRAAVAVVEGEAPDLVLMDVMMPGMDGREAYLAMRAHPNGRTIPIVLSSALVDPGALDPGVSAFLPKPFDLDHLLQLVERLLSDGTPR